MKSILSKVCCLTLLMVSMTFPGQQLGAQQISPFGDGDRVVFLGNSITDGGHYHSFIWLYYLTRFPDMNFSILNAGIGGDRVVDMVRRLDGDVLGKNPTVLITTFGMNDTGYLEYNGPESEKFADEQVSASFRAYQAMEKRFQRLSGTRLVLLGSTPYDEFAQIEENNPLKNKNKAVQRIVDFQRESAKNNGWEFFDFNAPLTALNHQIQKEDPTFSLSGNDRIHPDNNGHMVMAYLFLKAQGFSGKKVAETVIDADRGELVSTENCTIWQLDASDEAVHFDYLAESLPYPLDTTARGWGAKYSQFDAIKIVPFMEEMNQEILRVSGLNGQYRVSIDGQEIGTWSAQELAQGVNLAAVDRTPQYQQAMKVMYLNEERWETERRFRELAWVQFNFFQPRGLLNADNREAIEVMDKEVASDGWLRAKRDVYVKAMHPEIRAAWRNQMDDLIARMRRLSQPVNHRVSLMQIKN